MAESRTSDFGRLRRRSGEIQRAIAEAGLVGRRELDEALRALPDGRSRVAIQCSERDAVPAVDVVPAGVVELGQ